MLLTLYKTQNTDNFVSLVLEGLTTFYPGLQAGSGEGEGLRG